MSEIAIRAEDLSKLYRIGEHRGGYETLREKIVNTFSSSFRYLCRNPQSKIRNPQSETIWALKGISFEVRNGEVVGIIGRNGAGKTTLLKILSRITEPSEGLAEIRGRVGSLLEVGTGFHPELTGRENIYLNGAILGMKRAEINRKFDEIVAFAEIEKFIDTPVKRYSSGMYVRLAFAVAAHLEPEILLVDEVLAVGDVAFQKKCLGKMGDVAKEGRTVLFVSHQMGAVGQLCQRTILLDDGKVKKDGLSRDVIASYLMESTPQLDAVKWEREKAPKCDEVVLLDVRTVHNDGKVAAHFSSTEEISVEINYEVLKYDRLLRIWIRLSTPEGTDVFAAHNGDIWGNLDARPKGIYKSRCIIPGNLLNTGKYIVNVAVGTSAGVGIPSGPVLSIEVTDTDKSAHYNYTSSYFSGVVRPKLDWEISKI
jgi:lipopolysaccharide transport system ATP-binding protein